MPRRGTARAATSGLQAPEPLPRQIARQFRDKILLGDIHDRDILPSSAALARAHRVSVSTIRQAYEGLVEMIRETRTGVGGAASATRSGSWRESRR